MTRWLLALAILGASTAYAHAAVGVMLPLPVFLLIFAVLIGILALLLVVSGMSRVVGWWSKRALGAKVLISALLAVIAAGLVATWIYQDAIADEWNWVSIMKPYRAANFDGHVLTAERERALKPLDVFRECAENCPEMVVIPAGRFKMGSPTAKDAGRDEGDDYGRQHDVTISRPFAVSKFDVTFLNWDACVAVNGCPWVDIPHIPFPKNDNLPVHYVSWYDARAYVAWLSRMTGKTYRLLTEAEWEYVARAGTTTVYPWGETCDWCDTQHKADRVGSYKPNAFGLHDITDDVHQWVEDCWHPNYNGAPTDGSAWPGGDCGQRVTRGGRGKYRSRSANREQTPAEYKGDTIGVRVARTLAP
jgi:formylglycine-generating enzyme required for sulfatase activity